MAKQSKKPADLNRLAAAIVDEATDGSDNGEVSQGSEQGREGGRARAAALSPERRAEIAKKAAQARWEGRN